MEILALAAESGEPMDAFAVQPAFHFRVDDDRRTRLDREQKEFTGCTHRIPLSRSHARPCVDIEPEGCQTAASPVHPTAGERRNFTFDVALQKDEGFIERIVDAAVQPVDGAEVGTEDAGRQIRMTNGRVEVQRDRPGPVVSDAEDCFGGLTPAPGSRAARLPGHPVRPVRGGAAGAGGAARRAGPRPRRLPQPEPRRRHGRARPLPRRPPVALAASARPADGANRISPRPTRCGPFPRSCGSARAAGSCTAATACGSGRWRGRRRWTVRRPDPDALHARRASALRVLQRKGPTPGTGGLPHELAAAALLAVFAAGLGAGIAWSLPYLPLCFSGSSRYGSVSATTRSAATDRALEDTTSDMKHRAVWGAAAAGGGTLPAPRWRRGAAGPAGTASAAEAAHGAAAAGRTRDPCRGPLIRDTKSCDGPRLRGSGLSDGTHLPATTCQPCQPSGRRWVLARRICTPLVVAHAALRPQGRRNARVRG